MAPLVARTLVGGEDDGPVESTGEQREPRPLYIKGTEGMVVTFAKCCRPIPGDPILGFLSAGRGIVIHTRPCKNVAEFRKLPEKWLDVEWEQEQEMQGDFPVEVRVSAVNQRGVLATVAAAVAECEANIDNVTLDERHGEHTTINLTISVRGRRHLARIMRRVRAIEQVVRITRPRS